MSERCKSNKICVYKGNEFENRSRKLWSQDDDIEMNSTHNEGKSVVAERLLELKKVKSINDFNFRKVTY